MAKKCGFFGRLFGMCGKGRMGGYEYKASDFSKGAEVSISAVQYFNRHGVVTKTPGPRAKTVPVRVNLINKVVKFAPWQLRVV